MEIKKYVLPFDFGDGIENGTRDLGFNACYYNWEGNIMNIFIYDDKACWTLARIPISQ